MKYMSQNIYGKDLNSYSNQQYSKNNNNAPISSHFTGQSSYSKNMTKKKQQFNGQFNEQVQEQFEESEFSASQQSEQIQQEENQFVVERTVQQQFQNEKFSKIDDTEDMPIQFIAINEEGKIFLNPQIQEILANYDNNIEFISLIGQIQTGKTFLLNHLVTNSSEGFYSKQCQNGCTKGV